MSQPQRSDLTQFGEDPSTGSALQQDAMLHFLRIARRLLGEHTSILRFSVPKFRHDSACPVTARDPEPSESVRRVTKSGSSILFRGVQTGRAMAASLVKESGANEEYEALAREG